MSDAFIELDGDELFALVASAAVVAGLGGRWVRFLAQGDRFARNRPQRLLLGLWPVACLALAWGVLACWADPEVRDTGIYLLLFLIAGAALLFASLHLFPLVGLSPYDDVVQAPNPAATIAVCGALLGVTLCYAGANSGSGPTIWTTLIPAVLAIGLYFLCWLGFELASRCSSAASGIRRSAPAR